MIEQATKFCDKILLKGPVIYLLLGLSLGQLLTSDVLSSEQVDESEFSFVSKDLRAKSSSIEYTKGNFPGSYDALAHIGMTPSYEGTNESIYNDPSSASIKIFGTCFEEGKCLVVDSPPLSTEEKKLQGDSEHRTHITSTISWPHRIHGHLIMKFPKNKTCTGSGILVGPHHVLTAAHNLCDSSGQWATEVFFAPGRNEGEYPYADSKGSVLLVHQKWIKNKKFKDNFDLGMVILDSPIGLVTGWSGLLSLPDILLQDWSVSVTGYPGEKGQDIYKSAQLWTMSKTITKVSPAKLFYEICTTKGQSGSGIWGDKWPGCDGIYTVGVHTGTETDDAQENRGVRLSQDKFKLILHWLTTYQLKDITLPSLALPQADYSPDSFHFLDDLCTNPIWTSRARRAKENEKEALYHVGCLYANGQRDKIQTNPSYAFACFYRSAEQKYPPALTALGVCYETGQGIEPNPLKAAIFYDQAKMKGDREAFRRLGILYFHGTILPSDSKQARNLFETAYQKGDKKAGLYLHPMSEKGIGMLPNEIRAAKLNDAPAKKRGYALPTGQQLSISAPLGGQRRVWELVTQSLPVNNLPDRLSGDFIESKPEGSETSYLTSLWENLYQQDASGATITSAHKSGTLTGMGGIGKSTLSLAYAYEALDHKAYDLIYWLNSETDSSLFAGYKKLLKSLKIPLEDSEDTDEIVSLIRECVPAKKKKWLLIYDNVPNDSFLKNKTPQSGGHTLVTSRCHAGWDNLLHLDVFSPEDSIKYLLKSIKLEDSDTNRQQALDLSHALGYFPLALSHAVAYIKYMYDYTLNNYLEAFQKQPESHFIETLDPFSDKQEVSHENLIVKTLGLSGKMITSRAKDLLLFFSYLNPDDIPMEVFLKDKRDLMMLSNFSLIKIKNGFMSVHRLIQLVNRTEQEKKEKIRQIPHHLGSLLNIFLTYWQKGETKLSDPKTFYQWGYPALSHLESVYDHLERLQKTEHNFVDLKIGTLGLQYLMKESFASLRKKLLKINEGEDHIEEDFSPKKIFPKDDRLLLAQMLGNELKEKGREFRSDLLQKIIDIFQISTQYEWNKMIEILMEFDPDRLGDVTETALKFITDDMKVYVRAIIIRAIGKIDPDQFELVIETALKFITDDMNGYDRVRIIEALVDVDPKRLKLVTAITLTVITGDMDEYQRGIIIITLGNIDPVRFEIFPKNALKVITNDMNGLARERIINAFGAVDPSQLRRQLRLISDLCQVDPDRIERVTDQALKFITSDMGGSDWASIIRALGTVDPDRLDLVTETALKFINDDMEGYQRASFIRALDDVETNLWDQVIEKACLPLLPDQDHNDISLLLKTILSNILKKKPQVYLGIIKKGLSHSLKKKG